MCKKIAVVTGTRAEYGLLSGLMRQIAQHPELDLQVFVTGMHLAPEFGLSYQQIEQDGFKIDAKIEILLSSDTAVGISQSMGLAMIGFANAYARLQPDLLLVLGDRFEIFAAASAATIANIPITHLHGGETTEGAFDEAFRHAITKMAHLHFTATKVYQQRVIQLGEQPQRVFNVGAIGIDAINNLNLLNRADFEKSINFKLGKRNLLVTFHPVTLEQSAALQCQALLNALDKLEDTHIIFTGANADTDGRIINQMCRAYADKHPQYCCFHQNLGQLRYLSALKHIDAVVGNSSSGLLEAPSFHIATINIGDRQRGRIQGETVINCSPTAEAILTAIQAIYNPKFQAQIKTAQNPYGSGGTVDKILEIMLDFPLNDSLKKPFYDLATAN